MQYLIKSVDPANQGGDCLIVGVFQAKQLSSAAQHLDELSHGVISQILEKGDLAEELGKTLLLYSVPGISATRVLLVYCGEASRFTFAEFRKVTSCVAGVLKSTHIKEVTTYLTDLEVKGWDLATKIRQTILLTEDCFYHFDQFKTKKSDKSTDRYLENYVFHHRYTADISLLEEVLTQSVAITTGINFSKELANLPANVCTPSYIAEEAKKLAKEAKLTITVLEKEAIEKEGMGALLAVAQGSTQAPRFVTLEYRGTTAEQKPVVLVGKGVTFDSGGICIKPAAGMEEMKFDMAGAASVLGTFKTITMLKLPINVVAVMPLTENLPSGSAVKPGDIVKSLSGQTIEVINTDAEGRLILADALTYSEQFNPEVVIDMATLTGAIIVALGAVATGLMSNDVTLAGELEKAGEQSYDRVWTLPLWDDYQEQIDSNVADISNIGIGGAKSITAACFLSRFTKRFKWAHLDIAGTAWKSGKDKTATGRPVALLVQFLLNRCNKASQ
jgi:leucyl aminopeptidase